MLDDDIKKSIDAKRFHHQLWPMEIVFEPGLKQVRHTVDATRRKILEQHKTARFLP